LIRKSLQTALQLKELFRHQTEMLMKRPNDTKSILDHFKRLSEPLENSFRFDLETLLNILTKGDLEEIKELNKIAQTMIYKSQNPKDCAKAKKLHCSVIHKTCGFGCMMHDYGSCMFVAVGEGRSMQYDLNQQTTYPGLGSTFKYASDTCVNRTNFAQAIHWKPLFGNLTTIGTQEVVTFNITGPFTSHPLFRPGTVPDKILPRIQRVHADPKVWWTGHVISYFLRLQKSALADYESFKKKIRFNHPIVGIHVRRTDKHTEAPPLALERYMDHVIRWFDRYEMRHPGDKVIRRVYLATDEPEVIKEANTKYPSYTFVTAPRKSSGNPQNRSSSAALAGILYDILALKDSDFIVVTLSSNVGRTIYELRQTLPMDPTFSIANLDDSYNYWGEIGHKKVATMDHKPPPSAMCNNTQGREYFAHMRKWTCEIELRVGDDLQVMFFMEHGYLIGGYNRRTHLHGLFPAHKVKEVLIPAPYNTY
uniref:GT23 domain-containing protein n=1 Tax=Ciona savignyi TaxID=51511 RepID=H2Z3T9_CIOSA